MPGGGGPSGTGLPSPVKRRRKPKPRPQVRAEVQVRSRPQARKPAPKPKRSVGRAIDRGATQQRVRQIRRRERRAKREAPYRAIVGLGKEAVPLGPRRPPPRRAPTMLTYRNPARQRKAVRSAERAARKTQFLVDPKTRNAYRVPSEDQIGREYRAVQKAGPGRSGKALKRLERWGLEGADKGNYLMKPLGRLPIPESSLKRERKVIAHKPGGKPVYAGAARDVYKHKGNTYVRSGKGYRAAKTGFRGAQPFHDLAKAIGKQRLPSQGTAVRGPGGIPLAATGPKIASGGALSRKNVRAAETFGGRAVQDVVTLPANVVVGGYYTGRAGVKAALGDTKEGKQLWKDFKAHDPIALAAQLKFKKAGTAALKHPVATGLELYGGAGAADRLLGRAARAGSGGKVASRNRRLRTVPGTNIVQRRHYPPGLVARQLQVRKEGKGRKETKQLRRDADVAESGGAVDLADELRGKATKRDPDRVPESHLQHLVDIEEGVYQSSRRPNRAETGMAARQAIGRARPTRLGRKLRKPKEQPGGEGVSLIAQGITKADPNDLKAYLGELKTEAPKLRPAKRKANLKMQQQIGNVLKGKDVDMDELQTAARGYAGVVRPLERELVAERMLEPGEAEAARLLPYARRQMRAYRTPEGQLVRDVRVPGKGKVAQPVRTADIRSHMAREGVDPEEISFQTHSPSARSAGAFNVSGRRPQGVPQRSRTGEAVPQGLIDTDPERLVEQAVRTRGLVDANRHWKGLVNRFFYRETPDGKPLTRDNKSDAEKVVRDLNADPSGYGWRAVRLNPWLGRENQLQKLKDEADEEGFVVHEGNVRHPVSEAVENAIKGEPGEGPWGVVPDVVARRMEEHAQVYRSGSPGWRVMTQMFRRTVLPFSASWYAGNVLESILRAGIKGAGPRSWLTFRRTYNELAQKNPAEAARLIHTIPGGHYGGMHETMIHTSARQFENTSLEPLAKAISAFGRKPGPKQISHAFMAFTDWVFGTFNASIEAQFTRALAGRHMREHVPGGKGAGALVAPRGTLEKAVEQAARGVRGTHEQVAMADWVRRAYGQYDSFNPAMRRWILNYTPFGAWTWNAIKFVGSVLPKDHPALVAVIAANHQLTEDWRKEKGLDQYASEPLPDFLQGSIPLPTGGHLRVARYTPFGFWSTPLETVAANVMPQITGPLMAFRGLDWKGDKLKNKDGNELREPEKLLIGGREFAFAMVPIVGQVARGVEKGSPIPVINPFQPVKPKKNGAGGGAPKNIQDEYQQFKERSKPDSVQDEYEKWKQKQGR